MKYFYVVLGLLLMPYWMSGQIQHLDWSEKNQSFTVELEQVSTSFEICGLEKGEEYYMMIFDNRSQKQCDYKLTPSKVGVLNNKIDAFIADNTCMKLSIERLACRPDIQYHFAELSVIQIQQPDTKMTPMLLNENSDVEYLVRDVLMANNCGEVFNITTRGQIGTFSDGSNSIGIEDGIIMCTAPIGQMQGGNSGTGQGGSIGTTSGNDIDLSLATGNTMRDAAVIEFDFTPTDNVISFSYVFASEEYCDYAPSMFNDAFGFFLSGPGITGPYSNNGTNLATIPGTDEPVTINNIHWYGTYPQYYITNVNIQGEIPIGECSTEELASEPCCLNETVFDGFTTVLTAEAAVNPCETYHIRLVIADAVDQIFGSAVFLKSNDFNIGAGLDYEVVFNSTGSNHIYEGCGDSTGVIQFIRQDAGLAGSGQQFINMDVSAIGTATQNQDYAITFNNNIIIPPLPVPGFWFEEITVFSDDLVEQNEFVQFDLEVPCECGQPNLGFTIVDVPEIQLSNIPDITVCPNEQILINPQVTGGLPQAAFNGDVFEYNYQWTGNEVNSNIASLNRPAPSEEGVYLYTLDVSDDCGKTDTKQLRIYVQNTPNCTFFANPCIPVGEDNCINAPLLSPCQLDGWMGNTNPPDIQYTPGNTIPNVGWCGNNWSIENNQWLAFTAQETELIIGVNIEDCSEDAGIQMAVYEAGPGYVNSDSDQPCIGQQYSCIGYQTGEFTYFEYNILGTTPGDIYLIMIDGFGGDNCPFSFDVISGANTTVNVSVNASPVCFGVANAAALNGFGTDFGAGIEYIWETQNGNIVTGETTLFPVIDRPGEYTLTVIDNNTCCINSETVEVPEAFAYPNAVANVEGVLSCDNTEVTVNAIGSSGGGNDNSYAYQWYDPNGNDIAQGFELDSITEPGEYTLQVVDFSTGCVSETTVDVQSDTISPIAVIDENIDLLTCSQTIVTLDATGSSTNVSYQWQTPASATILGSSPEVSEAGIYTLIVTDQVNGCTDTAMIEVFSDTELVPDVSTNPNQPLCNGTATLQGNTSCTSCSFEWQDNTGTISNTSTVQVSTEGIYTLIVTDQSNGCSAQSSVQVLPEDCNSNCPTIIPNISCPSPCTLQPSDTIFLGATGTNLPVGGCLNWYWSSDANFPMGGNLIDCAAITTDTTAEAIFLFLDPTTFPEGEYFYTYDIDPVTGDGCAPPPIFSFEAECVAPDVSICCSYSLTCCENSVTLEASSSISGVTYSWGSNTIEVSESGEYSVIATAPNGCTASEETDVSSYIDAPSITIDVNEILTCETTEIEINVDVNGSGFDYDYYWEYPDGSSLSTSEPNIFVTEPGEYGLTVTDYFNCCQDWTTVNISQDIEAPQANAGSSMVLNCTNQGVVILEGNDDAILPNVSYQWQNSTGMNVGSSPNLAVSDEGTYTLIVTNENNGCTSSSSVEVVSDFIEPQNVTADDGLITCTTNEFTLNGSTSSSNVTTMWTGAGGYTSTEENPIVASAGTYTYIVTDNINGCTATAEAIIVNDDNIPQSPTVISNVPSNILNCNQPDFELTGIDEGNEPNILLSWTLPDGTVINSDIITVDQAGEYILTATAPNGCTSIASYTVLEDFESPMFSFGDDIDSCSDETTQLQAPTGFDNYLWSTGESTSTITVNTSNVYSLTVTDTNGCTASDEIEVVLANNVTAQIDNNGQTSLGCDNNTLTLTAQSTNADTFIWLLDGTVISNTANIEADAAGTYQLIATDMVTGCADTATQIITLDEAVPVIALDAPSTVIPCDETSIFINTLSTNSNLQYNWTTNDGTILGASNQAQIEVSSAGLYEVIVTDNSNGCTTTESINITSQTLELVSIQNDTTICDNSVTLTATLPNGAQGYWTSNTPAVINNPLNPIVQVDSLSSVINEFTWHYYIEGCDEMTEDVIVTIEGFPLAQDDVYNVSIGGNEITLNLLENDEITGLNDWDIQLIELPVSGSVSATSEMGVYKYITPAFEADPDAFQYVLCNEQCGMNCDTATVYVNLDVDCDTEDIIYIPNVITPRSSPGLNDEWIIDAIFLCPDIYAEPQVHIYNRWGSIVFETDAYKNDWDGTYNGKSLPDGTYYYIVRFNIGEGIIRYGYVTVLDSIGQ